MNSASAEPSESERAAQAEHEAVKSAASRVSSEAAVPASGKGQEDVVEYVEQEVMAKVSPDGRSPDSESRHKGRTLFIVSACVALGIGTVVLMYFVGGAIAIIAGAAYVLILIVAGMPVWGAGLLRRHEEHEVKTEVTHVLRQRRRQARHDRHAP